MLEKHMGAFPRYRRGEFAEGPSFHQYYNKCFVVAEDHFEAVLKEMAHGVELSRPGQPAVVDVKAYTRSGEMQFENLSEVVSYGNDQQGRLQSIGISVRADDESMAAIVCFQDYFPGWSASVVVEGGDEQASLGLFNKLRGCVESTFQWYSFLLSTRFWIGLTVLVIIAYIASLVGPALLEELDVLPPATEQNAAAEGGGSAAQDSAAQPPPTKWRVTSMLELGIITVVALFLAVVVLPYLFPRGVFLIGQETRRAGVRTKLRWGLLVVLILLPIGAVVSRFV